MLQHLTQVIKLEGLHGAIAKAKKPQFTTENWLNGKYQDSLSTYLNEETGFRPTMVRLHNTVQYHAFNLAKGREIIIGKEDCLYGLGYIHAANGSDYLGEDSIRKVMDQVEQMNDWLEKRNKHLVLVYAPGKGSFYPEYIPDRFLPLADTTNYTRYVHEAEQRDLNLLDANQWFRDMKDTSQHTLYPMHGIHWSTYGHALVQDSLEKYVEALVGKDVSDFTITGLEQSTKPRDTDDDMERGCNLMWKLEPETLTYPQIAFNVEGKYEPKMIAIGDSFFWNLLNASSVQYSDLHFYYYYREDHHVPESVMNPIEEDHDLLSALEETDIVMLVITDAQMNRFGWGFFDRFDEMIDISPRSPRN